MADRAPSPSLHHDTSNAGPPLQASVTAPPSPTSTAFFFPSALSASASKATASAAPPQANLSTAGDVGSSSVRRRHSHEHHLAASSSSSSARPATAASASNSARSGTHYAPHHAASPRYPLAHGVHASSTPLQVQHYTLHYMASPESASSSTADPVLISPRPCHAAPLHLLHRAADAAAMPAPDMDDASAAVSSPATDPSVASSALNFYGNSPAMPFPPAQSTATTSTYDAMMTPTPHAAAPPLPFPLSARASRAHSRHASAQAAAASSPAASSSSASAMTPLLPALAQGIAYAHQHAASPTMYGIADAIAHVPLPPDSADANEARESVPPSASASAASLPTTANAPGTNSVAEMATAGTSGEASSSSTSSASIAHGSGGDGSAHFQQQQQQHQQHGTPVHPWALIPHHPPASSSSSRAAVDDNPYHHHAHPASSSSAHGHQRGATVALATPAPAPVPLNTYTPRSNAASATPPRPGSHLASPYHHADPVLDGMRTHLSSHPFSPRSIKRKSKARNHAPGSPFPTAYPLGFSPGYPPSAQLRPYSAIRGTVVPEVADDDELDSDVSGLGGPLAGDETAFRVVGVLPSASGTSNRVAIFLSPVGATAMPAAAAAPTAPAGPASISSSPGPYTYNSPPVSASAAMAGMSPYHHGALLHAAQFPSAGSQSVHHIPRSMYRGSSSVMASPASVSAASPATGTISSLASPALSSVAPPAVTAGRETLKEIDLTEFNTDRILVRFSTSEPNPNEKLVRGEWKGRARNNELYSSPRMGPRIEVTRPGGITGDKSGFVAFNTLCKAAKMQSLYLASELRDVGLFQGAQLHTLYFKVSDVPDRALENVRIACAWTHDESLTEFVDPADMLVVHGPKTLLQSDLVHGDWLGFPLDAPVEWNGRTNLVVELSKDETHASFSWPATGGLYFKSTTHIRTVAHKDNNDSSGQYPFTNWAKPARFRRVPMLAVGAACPPAYKLVAEVPLATFHGALVLAEVALDGVRFSKYGACFVHHDPEPIAMSRVLTDLARLLPAPNRGVDGEDESMVNAFHDVTFLVGAEQVAFHAHQAILASRSPVFKAMFTAPPAPPGNTDAPMHAGELLDPASSTTALPPTHRHIPVPDLSPAIFASILTFIYTASVEIALDDACEVLKAADRYAMLDLKRSCEEFLKQNTSIENVTALLLAAEKFKVPSVRSFACDFVLWHFDQVSREPSFARDVLPRPDLVRELLLARRRGVAQHVGHLRPALAPAGAVGGVGGTPIMGGVMVGGAPTARAAAAAAAGTAAANDPSAAAPGAGNPHHGMVPAAAPHMAMTVAFPAGLFADLKTLLHAGPLGFPDVQLLVGTPNPAGDTPPAGTPDLRMSQLSLTSTSTSSSPSFQVFYAHKVILCTRCEVLAAMFRSQMRESAAPHHVAIPNIRPAVFASLLAFLYVGRCDLTYGNVFELYRAADQYVLHDLKDACEDFLMQEISIDNVGAVMLDSDDHQVGPVRSFAIDLAVKEFDDVSVTQKFLSDVVPRQDVLLEILQARGSLL
ncbi:Radial spoke head 14 [Allomyces javanicus]|nr:Radial spoke head 14 [Allomyces javanicus]